MGGVVSHFLFQPPEESTPMNQSKITWIETKLGSRIPSVYIEYPKAKYTILYSHGNAEDLGMIHPFLVDVGRVLKVNVMAYDYTGYGFSREENAKQGSDEGERDTGSGEEQRSFDPSEENCYADISAVYDHLTSVRQVPSSKIIVYGRSVGSGPSVYLAQQKTKEGQGIAGLVLHSPFMSVCRIVVDLGFTVTGDVFPNIDRLPEANCPIYIIHGTEDEIVPFYHGENLYKAVSEHCAAMPFWAEGMGHNDIEVKMPTAYIKRLYRFISQIDKQAKAKTRRELALSKSMSSEGELKNEKFSSDIDLSRSDSSLDVSDWKFSDPSAAASDGPSSTGSQQPAHQGAIESPENTSQSAPGTQPVRNRERTVSPPRRRSRRRGEREKTVSPPRGGKRTTGLNNRRAMSRSVSPSKSIDSSKGGSRPMRRTKTGASPDRSRRSSSKSRQRSISRQKNRDAHSLSSEGRSPSPTRVRQKPSRCEPDTESL
uniref:Serine aminopeptidase S33 domain-containing protein n=1 Tax=Odontella aurita TaxID=265563 RepID=A0A7S4I6B9_9STRA|mmetsp:Transcript_20579/g.59720  ORF Transcript_20579/g.59720 Transcript_20579/m.59720 type:complete len:484 (+) Transcript_20579:447-1898(+)